MYHYDSYISYHQYSTDDGIRQLSSLPPTASTVSAARGLLACMGFVPLLFINKSNNDGDGDNSNDSTTDTTSFLMAALEIAFWNFSGTGLAKYWTIINIISTGILFNTNKRRVYTDH